MRNYEVLREAPSYKRDVYLDLKRIEERGKRKKSKEKTLLSFFQIRSNPRTA